MELIDFFFSVFRLFDFSFFVPFVLASCSFLLLIRIIFEIRRL